MTFIWYFVGSLILSVASSLLFRKGGAIQKASLEDFSAPTATHDRRIPTLFGTCMLRSANVVWYGDLRSRKVKAGGFLGIGKQTIAYRYFLSWEYTLGYGEFDSISRICVEEEEVWSGTLTGAPGAITVDLPQFFGGKKAGGGIGGDIRFYSGTDTQVADPYLLTQYTVPARRGLAYMVFEDFEVGYQTRVPTFSIEGTRLAKGPGGLTKSHNGLDSNPAYIIYELLTDPEFGSGFSTAKINEDSFDAAADVLEAEEFGMSMVWDTPNSIDDLIEEVEKHVDCRIFEEPGTGLIKIRLIRQDYNVADLLILEESHIRDFPEFSRTGISDLANQVNVRYTNRDLKYEGDVVIEQNVANRFAQQRENLVEVEYRGVKTPELSRRLAARDLIVLGTPLATGRIDTTRIAAQLEPGEPFIVNFPEYCLENAVFRATEIDKGTLKDGTVKLRVVEDLFGLPDSIYDAPPANIWVDPCQEPIEYPTVLSIVAPSFITEENRAMTLVCEEATNQDYDIYTDVSGTFEDDTDISSDTPCGTIDAAIAEEDGPNIIPGPLGITGDLSELIAANATQIRQGSNLAYLGDGPDGEWVAFQGIAGAGNTWTVTSLWRGLLDTLPQDHPAGTRIWFASYGHGLTQTDTGPDSMFNVKIVPGGFCGELEEQDVTTVQNVQINSRASRPWSPGQFRINSISYPTAPITSGGLPLTINIQWNNRDGDAKVVYNQSDIGSTLPVGVEYDLTLYNGPTNASPVIRTENLTTEVYVWDWVADGVVAGTVITAELVTTDTTTGLENLYTLTRTFTV